MSTEDKEVLDERIRKAELAERKTKIKSIRKKGKEFRQEFKKFITRGNVIDLAVALVIGSAFNKIVNGLVNFIIMPAVGYFTNGISMTDWKWWIIRPDLDESGEAIAGTGLAIQYGSFIEAIVNFLIIALTIFIALRIIQRAKTRLNAREEEKRNAEAAKAAEEKRIADEAAKAAAEEARQKEEQKAQEKEAFYRSAGEQTALLREILTALKKD